MPMRIQDTYRVHLIDHHGGFYVDHNMLELEQTLMIYPHLHKEEDSHQRYHPAI